MRKNSKVILSIVAVVVVIGAAFTAATADKHPTIKMDSTGTHATVTNKINIKDYMFSPAIVKVKVGTIVTWTNDDTVNHTITADNQSSAAPNSMDIAKGQTYSFTFKKAGTYMYHCFPHPYMHGTVEVTNS